MKILMLGWEYPPHHAGSLGRICQGYSEALAERSLEVIFALPEAVGDEPAAHMRLVSVFQGREVTDIIRARRAPDPTKKPYREKIETTLRIDPLTGEPQAPPGKDRGAAALRAAAAKGRSAGNHRYFGQYSLYGAELLGKADRFTDMAVPLLRNVHFDLIHAHEWMNVPAALKLKQATGRAVVYHVHSLESDRGGENQNGIIRDLEQWGLREADHLITVSHHAKNHLIQDHGVAEHRVSVIHNGVAREQGRRDYHLRPKRKKREKIVLFLGALIFQKGPEYFVDAAAKVVRSFPGVKFVISGSGDKLEATIRRVNEWGLSKHFHFTGLLKGKQVEQIFNEADLYVMPSVFDPFELAPLEALAQDTPVLVSKQSGVADMLRHVLKVDFWDVDKMAELMLAVLRYPALAKDMVAMAQRELLALHWRAAAEKTEERYKMILEGH